MKEKGIMPSAKPGAERASWQCRRQLAIARLGHLVV
jgi:hypothetical protein